MKLSAFILLFSICNLSAENFYAQTTRVSLDLQGVRIDEVFKAIENQTKFEFFYNNDQIDNKKLVSVKVKDVLIGEAIKTILSDNSLTYQIVGKRIIIVKENSFEDQLLNKITESKQQVQVTGTITDSTTGEPVIGATVLIEGSTTGVTTDMNGKYSILVPSTSATLLFSYVGYKSQKALLNGRNVIDIILVLDIQKLEEVVVVGYGTMKKSDLTGAVASIDKNRLEELPVTNALQSIEGSVGGVTVTQTSSMPGAVPTVMIRGQNSVAANSVPLIVVDGIPLFSGSFNDINPNDIESTEILKDASSTAIYGTRGSNGVILVTTKRGTTQKPMIRYSGYAGPEMMVNEFKPDGPGQYVRKYVTAMQQNGLVATDSVPTPSEIANYNAGKYVNWIKAVTQLGNIQDHNISISGGSKDIKYYISGDYLYQEGIVLGYQYTRVNFRSNVDANITDWLTVGTSIFYVNNNYDGGRADLLLATKMSPFGSEFDANHNFVLLPMSTASLYPNPLLNTTTSPQRRGQNLNGDFYVEVKPQFFKGFKYRLNAAYSSNPYHAASYTGRAQDDMQGTASISDTSKTNWIVENIVTYEKNIGNHHIDITGLYSAQENDMFADGVTSVGFMNDQLTFNNAGAGTTQSVSSGSTQQNYISQMGRINYTYAGKYLLTVTDRRDGYSAFGSNTSKYATFPSVAAGWNIAKESFFIPWRPILDPFKIRVSYGKSGNQAIPPYKTLSTQSVYQYGYNGTIYSGVVANQLGNSNLEWEYTVGLNIGLDFGLLKGRINGNIDVYDNKTSNLLLNRQLPAISGFTTILDNIGQTQNKGIEITLKAFDIQMTNFSWETSINFAMNQNKWLNIYGGNVNDLTNKWFVGKPVQAIYDYKWIGIWQVADAKLMARTDPGAKAGDLRMADMNGDSVINANDKIYLGTPFPKWNGGMTNTFRYKNLRLNIFIQTTQGVLKNNADLDFADQSEVINLPRTVGYWTASNPVNNRPSLRIGANAKGYGYPSDASYTRIKDVTLSYTVPQSILNKWKLAELTFYISGRNLYTFTKWQGWDPENNFTGGYGTYNNYPDVASYVFGINLAIR